MQAEHGHISVASGAARRAQRFEIKARGMHLTSEVEEGEFDSRSHARLYAESWRKI